uniref:Enoyl reductase (ER) domain-containing protein n=1 Tax=Chromera velia CCMP2878 TaxID=1169474 RepID=A0A0G4GVJ4_9ALVE|mmetsp:Transcript_1699/g.3505  ORF Transcript_1699/g.3505 Transcript_1699/m.3505 type:complete len:351 (+) Transcript_1699:130-1182(+)|eukprot:Cvel_23571.t1-p1 / transcript=Cvel_23571.t1 / gene=Cvel_23571 / organism=Chromera_velia_CCMP2878 / gene_product=Probable quinone oxidoreductase, putative / transcript_product=Probable quinone oxidoreductase, putative / location=Cvel_scaffold2444:25741-26790(+) / protein_length=350 / sequence_SO=supercontig / SO=protein_coding / is_pseudo=false
MTTTFTRSSIRVTKHGGADVLSLFKGETVMVAPPLLPSQVLVQHEKAGVNMIDTYYRKGLYPLRGSGFPFIPGTEGAGVVVAAGESEEAQRLLNKSVVFFSCLPDEGGYTTAAVHNANEVTEVPKDVPSELATVVCGIQGLTAHYLVETAMPPVSPQTKAVLLNAAAGGTGLLLAQMCKIRGAEKVIGICSGTEKAKLAVEVGGVDVVIDRSEVKEGWVEAVKQAAPGGVDVFYDSAGASTFATPGALSVLRPRGSLITFGNSSGPAPAIEPLKLTAQGSISLQRPKLNDFVADPVERKRRIDEMIGLAKDGKIKTLISIMPLSKAAEAQVLLESGQTKGKLLLDCTVVE